MPPPPSAFSYEIVETASGRQAAHRRGGEGPPVVLLHESPRSSAVLLPLAGALAERGLAVFALDTPGFGLSDPLPVARPSAADFADALAETLDAIGLARAPIYGTHTGAAIAMSFGLRFPERATALALDGYPVFTETEKEELLASYLAPFRPDWSGAHLAWLWGRVKDQFTFFPWYRRGEAARLPRPLPPLDLLQSVVADYLSAGDGYRGAYASAFRFDALASARAVRVPTTFLARSDDLLFGHLDRLPSHMSAERRIVRLGPDRPAWAAAIHDAMSGYAAQPAPARSVQSLEGCRATVARRIVPASVGALSLRVTGRRSAPPLVLLPEIPGAAAGSETLACALGASRRVLTVDPPGFGASSGVGEGASADDVAAPIAAALASLGLGAFDLVALGESAGVGARLAAMSPNARCFIAVAPVPEDEEVRRRLVEATADPIPRLDGGHLLAAWHQLRDRTLWRPWTDRRPETARTFGTDPDPTRLQAILTEWMRGGPGAGRATLAAALAEPLEPALAALEADKAVVMDDPAHPWGGAARALADRVGARFVSAPDAEPEALAAHVGAALEGSAA